MARHLARTGFVFVALQAAAGFASGCEDTQPLASGAAGPVVTEDAETCIVTHREPRSGDAESVWYEKRQWDAASRVLWEETTHSFEFDGRARLGWRFSARGRVEIAIGIDESRQPYQNFQTDYHYDAHDNQIEVRSSYPTAPTLMQPSDAEASSIVTMTPTYDGDRLVAAVIEHSGQDLRYDPQTQTFHEDAQGRCDRVESHFAASRITREYDLVETRAYDANGRLWRIEHSGLPAEADDRCRRSVTLFEYEDSDRLRAKVTTCDEESEPAKSVRTTTYSYEPDGTVVLSYLDDGYNDVPNDVVDGREVTRYSQTSTPACGRIEAAIAPPNDLRCQLPLP